MSDETFIICYKWMNDIELKVCTKEKETVRKITHLEKEVYSVIYGFSKDNQGVFNGSCQYIADLVGSNRVNVNKILKLLHENKLVFKTYYVENNVKICTYKAIKPVATDYTPCSQELHPPVATDYTPCSQELHNNINIVYEKDNDNKAKQKDVTDLYISLFEKKYKREPFIDYKAFGSRFKAISKSLGFSEMQHVLVSSFENKWHNEDVSRLSILSIFSNNNISTFMMKYKKTDSVATKINSSLIKCCRCGKDVHYGVCNECGIETNKYGFEVHSVRQTG